MKNTKRYLSIFLALALAAPVFTGCDNGLDEYKSGETIAPPSDKFNAEIQFVTRLTDGALAGSDADYAAIDNYMVNTLEGRGKSWLTVLDRADGANLPKTMQTALNTKRWTAFAFNRIANKSSYQGSMLYFNGPTTEVKGTPSGSGCYVTGFAPTLNGTRTDKDEDGKWYSVKELAGAGTDIDQVIISPMGSNNQTDVFVGYQNLTNDEKTMEIYSYTDGDFKRVALDTYSVLEPLDINNDGYIELITIQRSTNNDTGAVTAKASMLNMKNNEITRGENVDMCDNVTSYVSSKTGMLDSGRRAIFIDGLTADGKLQTEIIYYRYSGLQNPMQLRSEKLLPLCTRPAGYYSEDMDGDGDVEIPSTSPMVGYENAVADEMLYMTTWSVYEDFYDLKTKYTGYYAISDGYFVTFPKRWNSSVTVKKDSDTNELVFYKYTGDINESNEEIMRIAVSSKNDSEDYISDGYELIDSKGQLDYFVKLPLDRREKLIPTIDEIQNNFYIIN